MRLLRRVTWAMPLCEDRTCPPCLQNSERVTRPLRPFSVFFLSYIYLFIGVLVHTRHRTCSEVRGQLVGVYSLLPCVVPQTELN